MGNDSLRKPEYASDVVVDFMAEAGFPYISLNPGSSFRGLHDSLVNYRGDAPQMIECTHEKTAVGLAHGYARATGRPMAVAVHNLVGLMQSTMGVYIAQTDRAPVFMVGGTGPMDEARRRPWIDWLHSADAETGLIRSFTKADEHPASQEALWPALTRAYRAMLQAPRGPVYVALDSAIQEEPVRDSGRLHGALPTQGMPSPIAAAPGELEQVLDMIDRSERPVIVPGYLGSRPETFDDLKAVVERLRIGVADPRLRLCFPTDSPYSIPDKTMLREADLILLWDLKDPAIKTGLFKKEDTTSTPQMAEGAALVTVGVGDIDRGRWANDGGLLLSPDRAVTADGATALAQLRAIVEARPAHDGPPPRQAWVDRIGEARAARQQRVATILDTQAEATPVATTVLAHETWEAVKDFDWVLSAGSLNDKIDGVWTFDRHYQHPGRSLGTATQFAMSLGVALAHRDEDRLVVSLQPDGDLLFDMGGMWTASHYRLPLLCVMFNNRSYYNDWAHQIDVAEQRNRDPERAWIGMAIDDPAPDFSAIARGFGWHAEGPIDNPRNVRAAVRKAAEFVMRERRPALVDVVCQPQ